MKRTKELKKIKTIEKLTFDFDVLIDMYYIHAPSGFETGIAGYIKQKLNNMNIDFQVDEYNQIYNISKENKPLLCAHMDQVEHAPVNVIKETKNTIKGDSNIGADDKNGIYIILNLLAKYDCNFIFSTEEERGSNLDILLEDIDISNLPYALVFDRRNGKDIIGNFNDYCSEDFENEIFKIGEFFGYRPTIGIFSDCDHISEYINCVNLSCGYYKAHTVYEYSKKPEIINAYFFGKAVLSSDLENLYFDKPNKKVKNIFNHFHDNSNHTGYAGYSNLFDYNDNFDNLDNFNCTDTLDCTDKTELLESMICPECNSNLIDFVQDKKEGILCMDCDFEIMID